MITSLTLHMEHKINYPCCHLATKFFAHSHPLEQAFSRFNNSSCHKSSSQPLDIKSLRNLFIPVDGTVQWPGPDASLSLTVWLQADAEKLNTSILQSCTYSEHRHKAIKCLVLWPSRSAQLYVWCDMWAGWLQLDDFSMVFSSVICVCSALTSRAQARPITDTSIVS